MGATTELVPIQENGTVTLPVAIRERLGLQQGDLVAFVETADGILITSQERILMNALDRMGEALRERGVTLEEWIEDGRRIRGELIREQYGLDPDDDPA